MIAATLRRIRQNLGHPPNRELIRHLRLSGASEGIVRAAEQMQRRTCDKRSKPRPARVAQPHVALDFNQAVAIDIIWLDTCESKALPSLNCVDMSSAYYGGSSVAWDLLCRGVVPSLGLVPQTCLGRLGFGVGPVGSTMRPSPPFGGQLRERDLFNEDEEAAAFFDITNDQACGRRRVIRMGARAAYYRAQPKELASRG